MASTSAATAASASLARLQMSAAPLLFQTGLFGMYTLLLFLSGFILIRRGLGLRKHKIMLAVILLMYTLSTVSWSIQIAQFAGDLYGPSSTSSMAGTPAIGTIILGINVLLSDIIVLWRAHVIWGHNRYLVAVSTVLIILTSVSLIININSLINDSNVRNELSKTGRDTFVASLGTLSSLVTNVWATTLVVVKTCIYRRDVMASIRQYGARSTERLFMLLVESGMLYCVYWILAVSSSFISLGAMPGSDPAMFILPSILFSSIPQVAGIYPTVIIVFVCLQKVSSSQDLFGEHFISSQRLAPPSSQLEANSPVMFARPPSNSAMGVTSVQTNPGGSVITVTVDLSRASSRESWGSKEQWNDEKV